MPKGSEWDSLSLRLHISLIPAAGFRSCSHSTLCNCSNGSHHAIFPCSICKTSQNLLNHGGVFVGFALVLRKTTLAYRSLGAQSAILGYEEEDEVVQVVVDIRRPWKFGPGQYAYLTSPQVSTTAVFQSHPFTITWRDESHRRAYFLVSPQNGLSRRWCGRPIMTGQAGPGARDTGI